jgi:hypothetical protein
MNMNICIFSSVQIIHAEGHKNSCCRNLTQSSGIIIMPQKFVLLWLLENEDRKFAVKSAKPNSPSFTRLNFIV